MNRTQLAEALASMDWFLKGGPLMWPILLSSIVGFAIFIERTYVLARATRGQRAFLSGLVAAAASGNLDRASAVCRLNGGPVANVVETYLRSRHLPREDREQIVHAAANQQLYRLERGLRGLGVIGRVAPLLGLLGTVLGLVEAFIAVSTMQGPPDPSVLAGGIWQALLTTVAGLVVAIPAILSHEWLLGRIDAIAQAMEEAIAEITSIAAGPRGGADRETAA